MGNLAPRSFLKVGAYGSLSVWYLLLLLFSLDFLRKMNGGHAKGILEQEVNIMTPKHCLGDGPCVGRHCVLNAGSGVQCFCVRGIVQPYDRRPISR